MKEIMLRKKFYSTVIRSVFTLLALILLLFLAPKVVMLQNQEFQLNKTTIINGVKVAQVLLALVIVGVLLNFAYISESQLPKILTKFPQSGLIIASAIHIAVIFIAYSYLSPLALDRLHKVNQIFNAVFLILLCIPLFRGGKAYYEGTKGLSEIITNPVVRIDSIHITCDNCKAENDAFAKHCSECGNKLPAPNTIVCKNCSTLNDISAKHCVECGKKLQDTAIKHQTISCPQCGAENKLSVKHCSECGTDLTKTVTNTA